MRKYKTTMYIVKGSKLELPTLYCQVSWGTWLYIPHLESLPFQNFRLIRINGKNVYDIILYLPDLLPLADHTQKVWQSRFEYFMKTAIFYPTEFQIATHILQIAICLILSCNYNFFQLWMSSLLFSNVFRFWHQLVWWNQHSMTLRAKFLKMLKNREALKRLGLLSLLALFSWILFHSQQENIPVRGNLQTQISQTKNMKWFSFSAGAGCNGDVDVDARRRNCWQKPKNEPVSPFSLAPASHAKCSLSTLGGKQTKRVVF